MPRHQLAPWALALVVLSPALAFGQSGADLISDDATFALALNSISGVRDKAEKFLIEHKLRLWQKPSNLFKFGFLYLGIGGGTNEKGPAAIVLGSLKKADASESGFDALLKYLYFVVPVQDVGKMADNFGLKAADLKDGKAHPGEGGLLSEVNVLLKGKSLYTGTRKEKVLCFVPKAKPVTGALGAAQKAALAKSDLVMYFGAEALGATYGKTLDEAEKNLKRKDRADDAQSKLLIDALRELRFVVGGLNLDERKINVIATFKTGKDGARAKKFLTALRAGPGTPDLLGVPAGRPVAIFAAKGDGTSNVAMARALVNILFAQARIDKLLPGEERPAFVASLEKMYRELKGSRIALYANEDKKQGLTALVGILDIGDTEKHLAEMPNVVKRLNSALEKAAKGSGTKPMVFSYEGKAEKLDRLEVNVLRVKAPGLKDEEKKALLEYFGPGWDKVRIVVVGKKVAFLAGSNLGLLKEAITNLKKGAKGLAEDRFVAEGLARLSKERKVEAHVNLHGLALFRRGLKPAPLEGMTSLALTVQANHVQLEVVVAKSEVYHFATLFGLASDRWPTG
jgi:hypothetical protein